ncbi:MAG: tetratricopeptide repeat protein [Methylococcaceae bacterium]
MQKSDRDEKNNKKQVKSSVAASACPQCGSGETRLSRHSSRGFFNTLFSKAYRCNTCQFRFRVLSSLRLLMFAGILIFIFITVWMVLTQQTKTVSPVETVSQDSLESLAENGDAEAELKMGLRHTSMGWGVKDDKIAAQWFEKAAHHGLVDAQYRYGLALLDGQGVVQDYKSAFYWLEKAALQGHAQAESTLGAMYHAGIAINSDIERAYLWFNLAAAQGIGSAASARDIVVKLLTPKQIVAMQEEAGRISRGHSSLGIAKQPTVK